MGILAPIENAISETENAILDGINDNLNGLLNDFIDEIGIIEDSIDQSLDGVLSGLTEEIETSLDIDIPGISEIAGAVSEEMGGSFPTPETIKDKIMGDIDSAVDRLLDKLDDLIFPDPEKVLAWINSINDAAFQFIDDREGEER